MNFKGAGRQILLPLHRTWFAVSPASSLCAKLIVQGRFLYWTPGRSSYPSSHLTLWTNENKRICFMSQCFSLSDENEALQHLSDDRLQLREEMISQTKHQHLSTCSKHLFSCRDTNSVKLICECANMNEGYNVYLFVTALKMAF